MESDDKIIKQRMWLAMLIFILAVSLMIGCTSKQPSINVSTAKIEEQIKQSVNLDKLKKGDESKLKKLYGLDSEQVEEFILYTAKSNVMADEIVVIKVTDVKQVESVKSNIIKRIDTQSVKFKDYRPNEYALLEKHVVKVKEPYILFAVSTEIDQIELAFDEALK
ncbi:DUF4358 domain-containing protein [Paenibacillus sp. ACRRX]|uniref:DUF4358 domain-containing protein n=1 Tax=Paenibacillus sp. ACRRX TaxID=2918206 RepID=UPI001EF69720|nr:DUF4358 domain-containing protein [Paenibacillus sp. ACRRX]MCG7409482.1 DUF4358 domain-containing protein [Paenibacillus sp. ACRRX]